MKKLLLLIFSLISINSFSQMTCATAVNITANGSFVTGTVSGTHPGAVTGWCWTANAATPNALWYKFTPTSNGILTVTSAVAANPGGTTGIDSRLSILTGTCTGTWTCVDGNDDVSSTDYRAAVVDLQVTSGTTYYIVWDNRWDNTSFTFDLTFTGATCFAPTTFYLPDYQSTTSADLYWDQATPTPASYDVDWSTNYSTAAGSGTIVSASAGTLTYSSASLASLPASSNFRYFVRSNCSPSLSTWAGPYYAYLPVSLPYSNGFESATNNYTDGFINFSLFNSTATSNPANYADGGAGFLMYTFNSTTAASDLRGYFRGVSLSAGETATVVFKTRLYSTTTPSPMTFNLTVGDSQSAAAQTTVVQTITNSSAAAYTTHTATYTAPTTGIYYFSIHNNTPIGATSTFLMLDSINITSSLTTENFNVNSFMVYPNPINDTFTIQNSNNINIKSLNISDINGRTVKTLDVNSIGNEINVSDLNSGVYFLNINTDKDIFTKKIIKN